MTTERATFASRHYDGYEPFDTFILRVPADEHWQLTSTWRNDAELTRYGTTLAELCDLRADLDAAIQAAAQRAREAGR